MALTALTASGLAEHRAADVGKPAGASGSLLTEHAVLGVHAVVTSRTHDLPQDSLGSPAEGREPGPPHTSVHTERDALHPQDRVRCPQHLGWQSGVIPAQKDHLPRTAFGSVPKAQMHGEPEGT